MFRKTAQAAAIVATVAIATLSGGMAAKAGEFSVEIGIGVPAVEYTGGWHDTGWHGDRWRHRDLISPRRVERILYRRGFDNVEIVRKRGPNWIAEAYGPRGKRVRVVVDGYTGEIVGIRRLDWGGPRW